MASNTEARKDISGKKRKRHHEDSHAEKRRKKHTREKIANGDSSANPVTDGPRDTDKSDKNVAVEEFQLSKSSKGVSLVERQVQGWRLSEPMGGRMSNVDPMFTPDEKYLIVAYHDSIQVYATSDSLLVRRVPLPVGSMNGTDKPREQPHIVAASLSHLSSDVIWVGCSDGRIWKLEWTSGAVELFHARDESQLTDMTIQMVRIDAELHEILFTSEKVGQTSEIMAYKLSSLSRRDCVRLYSCAPTIQRLQSHCEPNLLVANTSQAVILGDVKRNKLRSLKDLKYQFYSFDTSDEISSFDTRCSARKANQKKKQASNGPAPPVVDLVVGCVRGAIFVYGDLLSQLRTLGAVRANRGSLHPRKHHWHRQAVESVKWSRDGNYLVSGGSEMTLVLWQAETSKRDFLPHLGACVDNIVVSPCGSSYAVHLDDNSTMVLSTAEMKPTCYISGLQSLTAGLRPLRESNVDRAWTPVDGDPRPLVAAISPADPSRILLGVGNGQRATLTGCSPSSSLLQTFDISSFRSISKQPLARTNPTDANLTSKGYPISEPTITHLSVSHDGKWLVSVDAWKPPTRDADDGSDEGCSPNEWANDRHEVHLKFWEAGKEGSPFELVSRINEAHFTTKAEPIFDVIADRRSSRFVTIGDDGMVRFWRPRVRQSDGLTVTGQDGRALSKWSCTQAVSLGESGKFQDDGLPFDSTSRKSRTGALAFSEDGSILFAAFGTGDDTVLYVMDSESGSIRTTLHGMFKGPIRGMASLSSVVVLLSNELKVYDLVADELRYGIRLAHSIGAASPTMAHLAVNTAAQKFALAVSGSSMGSGAGSNLAIFSPDQSQPVLVEEFPDPIVSLLPSVGSPGFIAVDSAAKVWSLVEATSTSNLAQPLSDLKLDGQVDTELSQQDTSVVIMPDDGDASEDEGDDADGSDIEDFDVHQAVVAPQQLADIFDAAPSFAMPTIEELFYRVTRLFSSRLWSQLPRDDL